MIKLFLISFSMISLICILSLTILGFQAKTDVPTASGHYISKNHSTSITVMVPKMNKTETGCEGGNCITKIRFSDEKIPPILITDCIGGDVTNLGDLNADGLDEIGFLPGWFAGCWHKYRVFTYKNKKWQNVVPPFQVHCNQFEAAGMKPVIKDPAKPGYVLVTYSAFEADSIVFKTRSDLIK